MKRRNWKTIAIAALSFLLAAAFFMASGFKLAGAEPMVANFERWGMPLWFMFVTGAVEGASAALLLFRKTRFYGAAMIVATMIGGAGIHLVFAEYGSTMPSLVLGSLSALVAWSTRPTWLPLVGARAGATE